MKAIFQETSTPLPDIFIRFGNLLRDEKILESCGKDEELLDFVIRMKRFAWAKMGGQQIMGVAVDAPIARHPEGTEFATRVV